MYLNNKILLKWITKMVLTINRYSHPQIHLIDIKNHHYDSLVHLVIDLDSLLSSNQVQRLINLHYSIELLPDNIQDVLI